MIVDLSDFRPTPTQHRFLASRARHVAFFGGYGSGKTRAGAEMALDLACANPGCAGIVVSPTWQMLQRTTLRTLREAIPRQIVASEHLSERRIRLVNGADVFFGSADKPGSLEGTNLAWAWLDEARLVSAESWRVLQGRVRDARARRLQLVVTTTPATGWLSEFFDGSEGRAHFHGSTAENAANLAPGFLDSLRRSYSQRLAEALIDGRFAMISGAVYSEWDESRHLVDWDDDGRHALLLGVDVGVRSPAVVAAHLVARPTITRCGSIVPAGSLVVVDEWVPDETPTIRLAPAMRQRWPDPQAVYVDKAGGARDQAGGASSIHYLAAEYGAGIVRAETDPARTWIPHGVALVQARLAPVGGGRPHLYVSRRLVDGPARGIVRAMRGYRYPEGRSGRAISDHPWKDGTHDHVADALRYLVLGAERADEGPTGGHIPVRTTWQGATR